MNYELKSMKFLYTIFHSNKVFINRKHVIKYLCLYLLNENINFMANWDEIPEIELYADGAAEPNPGRGGFGVIMSYKGKQKEFSQGYTLTTNNRMELMGVIFGLQRLKTKSNVHVYTDSKYVADGINKGWAQKWKSKNWHITKNKIALNYDLWERLLMLIEEQNSVTFHWIKGHNAHPENERCDKLATLALKSENLLEDEGYINSKKNN